MRTDTWRRALAAALTLLFCLAPGVARAQNVTPAAPARGYAEAAEAGRAAIRGMMLKDGVPGVGAAVAVGGEVVWAEGFGFADLERRAPVTAQTKFGIGSVTKSLTTALLGRLVEEGAADLDAPVERYLPDFPHKNLGISARLIAGHLSGLDDTFNTAHAYTTAHFDTTAAALGQIYKEPLRHRPRERHFYTTGPYTIIAGVIERASRRDFLDAMSHYVTGPLGLRDTVPNDRRAVVPHRTSFYLKEGGRTVNAPCFDPSFKWAGAGYLSTAGDVARFGSALLRPGFLRQSTLDELFRPLKTSAGEETGFGLGWRVGTDKKGRRIFHQPGGGPGISCWLVLYPEEGLAIAILSNQTGAPVGGAALDVIAESFITAARKSKS
ncbi:MAG TPA: serine hydrolase domain-containing protein [Pyrinomonadaceae bacterium]|nr:serine hydrolase domain-containing protein [Pyrinomonadaceae bacterium]